MLRGPSGQLSKVLAIAVAWVHTGSNPANALMRPRWKSYCSLSSITALCSTSVPPFSKQTTLFFLYIGIGIILPLCQCIRVEYK